MYIQELILDGFKSYPVRTQITGWDPSFNAITGLNGSGKSNILDAICFVLGLTNMASVSDHICDPSELPLFCTGMRSCEEHVPNRQIMQSEQRAYVLTCVSLDARAKPTGLNLQAWPSRGNQGQCDHRLRQLRTRDEPRGLRGIPANHCDQTGA